MYPEADGSDAFAGWLRARHIPALQVRLQLARSIRRELSGRIARITKEYEWEGGGGYTTEGVLTIVVNQI